MFSIQECVSKTEQQTKKVEEYMDVHGYFDPYECNIYAGLKRSIQRELAETFRRTTLKEWVTSTGLTTGSLGAGGVNYLVPTYVSTRLHMAMSYSDIAPAVSAEVFENQGGETVYVNSLAIALARIAHAGEMSIGGPKFNAATVKMERYTAPVVITKEMIEDCQYDLMEFAVRGAGVAMAKESNDKICATLKRTTGTTGWGDKTTEASGAGTTTPAHIAACASEVAAGNPAGIGMYRPNLLLVTPEVWHDALITTAGHPTIAPPQSPLFDAWYGGFNIKFVNSEQMGTVSANRLTVAVTIVMEREVAFVTARKNWLRIENYNDPVKDLAGAVVAGKQGVGELVDAAIGVLTET